LSATWKPTIGPLARPAMESGTTSRSQISFRRKPGVPGRFCWFVWGLLHGIKVFAPTSKRMGKTVGNNPEGREVNRHRTGSTQSPASCSFAFGSLVCTPSLPNTTFLFMCRKLGGRDSTDRSGRHAGHIICCCLPPKRAPLPHTHGGVIIGLAAQIIKPPRNPMPNDGISLSWICLSLVSFH